MKACILGAGGFLGHTLAQELQRRGHFVVMLDLAYQDMRHVSLDPSMLSKIKGSILCRDDLRQALVGCDACFHLASYGTVGGASLDREKTMLINVKGTELILQECLQSGIKRVVYASTLCVVWSGEKEVLNLDESAPYLSKFPTPYAESKCLAEKMVLRANGTRGLRTCALRPRGIYGPGEMRATGRIVDFCQQGLVVEWSGHGKPCLTQYSSGENVVNAMLLAEERLRQENAACAGKAYNIVDGGPLVEAFKFWDPLVRGGTGMSPLVVTVPYWFAYGLAMVLEWLYYLFGIEPMYTRLEVNYMAVTNTFSIENARRDLGYQPVNNHSLDSTILYFKERNQRMAEYMIRESHDAIARGEIIMRWWVGSRLMVAPLNGEALKASLKEPIVESSIEITKGPVYDFFKQWFGESIATTSIPERWRSHRKQLSPVFHFAPLRAYVNIYDRHAKALVHLLKEESGSTVDVLPLLKRAALDIVAEATLGVRFETLRNPDHALLRAADEFNTLAFHWWTNPFYIASRLIWNSIGYGRRTQKVLKVLKEMSAKASLISAAPGLLMHPVVTKRMERTKQMQKVADSDAKKEPQNFLDIVWADKDKDTVLYEELCEDLDAAVAGGFDTTAHTMGWTIWCLATQPALQDKVYEEIRSVLGEGEVDVTLEMVNELRYLDMCVKEAMRIFPTVPFMDRRLQNDMELGGKLVPKGSSVLISPLIIHHNYLTYPQHDDFDPDNFLPERAAQRNAYDYVPFSAGPRNCIGQKFAMVEIRAVLAHLFRTFRLETNLTMHDNTRAAETVTRPMLGFPVHVIRR